MDNSMKQRYTERLLRHLLPIIFVLSLFLIHTVSGSAAGKATVDELAELPLEELMRVKVLKVYGVSRYEQSALEAPANVSIITADAIRRYGYRTLSDILRGATGLYVTNDRNYEYLGYRGFSLPGDYNTRALIMVDGVRLNDAVYHQAPIGTDFPLDLNVVERIEIIRGPSQAIYGNNAFLLVINVITKAPPASAQAEAALYAESRGLSKGTVTAGVPVNQYGTGLLFSGTVFKTPGSDLYFPAYDDPATNNGMANGADYGKGGSAFFKAVHDKFSLVGGYAQNRKGIPTGAWGATFNDDATHSDDERFFTNLSYQALDRQTAGLKLRGYLNAYNYDGEYSYVPEPMFTDFSHSVTLGGETVGNVRFSNRSMLVAGLDAHFDTLVEMSTSDGFHDRRQQNGYGMFAQHEYRLFDPLLLMIGLRYDHFSSGLEALNPKAAVILIPREDMAIKYLFGKSFRAPNVNELYYATDGFKANPELTEETLLSHEVVVEYELTNRLRVTVTGFQYNYSDLIAQYIDDDGDLRFANSGNFRTRGIETELSSTWHEWSGAIGHTYQHTNSVSEAENPIVNSPGNLLKLRLSRELLGPKLLLSGELQYISRLLTLDPAISAQESTIVNLSLFSRDLLYNGLDASLSIYNLFDSNFTQPGANEHLPVVLIPQDGITAGFRLSYRW